MQISRTQHGPETLLKLQSLARHTIGVPMPPGQQHAERLSVKAWLGQVEALETEIRKVLRIPVILAMRTGAKRPPSRSGATLDTVK